MQHIQNWTPDPIPQVQSTCSLPHLPDGNSLLLRFWPLGKGCWLYPAVTWTWTPHHLSTVFFHFSLGWLSLPTNTWPCSQCVLESETKKIPFHPPPCADSPLPWGTSHSGMRDPEWLDLPLCFCFMFFYAASCLSWPHHTTVTSTTAHPRLGPLTPTTRLFTLPVCLTPPWIVTYSHGSSSSSPSLSFSEPLV